MTLISRWFYFIIAWP